ncbi:MAG TPA: protease pro-enzyme activation domain-containing protein [Acidobacteriaceae bacterium]
MRLFVRSLPGLITSFFFCVAAYGAAAPQRIVKAIDPSQLSEVRGSVPAATLRAADLGAAAGDTQLSELALRFNLTAEQQATLTQLLQDQQNPASARYHQWLTPEQFGAQFGLAPEDLQKVSNWLASQGFAVTQIARGGIFVRFSGTVAQANRAFHTQIHRLTMDGQSHISSLAAPQLPNEIAKVVGGISGLQDFRLKPPSHTPSARTSAMRKIAGDARPAATFNTPSGIDHEIAPADFYTIYNETPLLTSGINGRGVSIAVVGQSNVDLSDIARFRAAGGLIPSVPTQVLYGPDPGVSMSDLVESELDLEWAGATAPSAEIIFARGRDVMMDALTGVIDNNLAPIISISYGDCEADNSFSQSSVNSYYPLLQMASAQGQTIVADTGDFGATDCDYDSVGGVATRGLSVNFPASSPLVTAIGGTVFNEGSGTYWSATNGANMGSALSYIPEVAWGDLGDVSGGGGGRSHYFTKPYWQVGVGVPRDSSRDIPDVSLVVVPYLACIPGNCTNGYLDSAGYPSIAGAGTSFGTPAFAGLLALVVQKSGARIGNANPTIYALANSSYASSLFHDVTAGSNASPCVAGTLDCPASGSVGYSAGVGYDLATGWGSVDAFNLVNSWSLVTPIVGTVGQALSTTTLNGTPAVVDAGTAIQLTVAVASGSSAISSTPTGTVQFLLNNVAVGTAVPLSSGAAVYSLDTANMSGGIYTVQAAYSGDPTFAGSKSSFAITINSWNVPSTTVVRVAPAVVVSGMPIQLTATVASGSSANHATPTGMVQFLFDNLAMEAPVPLTAGTATYSLHPAFVTLGSHTAAAAYLGDGTFAVSNGSAAVTVINLIPDFTLTPAAISVTVKSGSSILVPFVLTGLNSFTGNVQFSTSFANAIFSPSTVTLSSTQPIAATSLMLNAYKPNASGSQGTLSRLWYEVGSGIALSGILMLVLPRRRRFAGVLAAVISIGMLAASGCAGGKTAPPTTPNPPVSTPTPPGTYAVTVTATGTSGTTTVTHTAAVTLIVQ